MKEAGPFGTLATCRVATAVLMTVLLKGGRIVWIPLLLAILIVCGTRDWLRWVSRLPTNASSHGVTARCKGRDELRPGGRLRRGAGSNRVHRPQAPRPPARRGHREGTGLSPLNAPLDPAGGTRAVLESALDWHDGP
jgi:hypothetical protein